MLEFVLEQNLILISCGLGLAPLLLAGIVILVAYIRYVQNQRTLARTMARIQTDAELTPDVLELEEVTFEDEPVTEVETVEEEKDETQKPEDKPADAMQDILSTVFEDDEANARFEVLLKATKPVAMIDLAGLCTEIVGALRR